jgi:hypothetical protein
MDPITVRGPDGRIFRFPADTPRETINASLATFYEQNGERPDAPGPNTWQETIRSEDLAPEDTPTALLNQGYQLDPQTGNYYRIVGNEAPEIEEYQPPQEPTMASTSPVESFALGALEQVPFALDALAGLGTLGGTSYTENRDMLESMAAQDREQQGLARNIGGVTGFGASMVVPGGAGARFISRGAGPGMRALRGAGVAGGQGAVYGAGTSRGGIQDRIEPTLVGAGGAAAFGAALSRFAPRAADPERAQTLAAFDRSQVDAIPSMVGGPMQQGLGATLRGNAIVGGPLQRAGERVMTQATDARDRIAAGLGEAEGAFQAGTALQRGARSGGETLKQRGSQLYETPSMRAIEESPARVRANNTVEAINNAFKNMNTPGIGDYLRSRQTDIAKIKTAIDEAGGTATFGDLRMLRDSVAAMLTDPQIISTGQQRNVKRLYGAISDDMTRAAGVIAGEGGQREAARAGAVWSATRSRVDDVLEQFVGGGVTPQGAFENLYRMAKTKGQRASWPQIAQLRRSLSDDDWREVSSGLVRTMGGEGDQFSPARFATQWRELTPEARRILFGKALPDMEALARVGDNFASSSRFFNASQSGNVAGNMNMLGSMATGAGAATAGLLSAATSNPTPLLLAIGSVGGGLAVSKLLSSPKFAGWLYKAERASNAGRAVPRLMGEIDDIARDNPTVRQWLNENRGALAGMLAGRQVGVGSAQSAETSRERRENAPSMTNPGF